MTTYSNHETIDPILTHTLPSPLTSSPPSPTFSPPCIPKLIPRRRRRPVPPLLERIRSLLRRIAPLWRRRRRATIPLLGRLAVARLLGMVPALRLAVLAWGRGAVLAGLGGAVLARRGGAVLAGGRGGVLALWRTAVGGGGGGFLVLGIVGFVDGAEEEFHELGRGGWG